MIASMKAIAQTTIAATDAESNARSSSRGPDVRLTGVRSSKCPFTEAPPPGAARLSRSCQLHRPRPWLSASSSSTGANVSATGEVTDG